MSGCIGVFLPPSSCGTERGPATMCLSLFEQPPVSLKTQETGKAPRLLPRPCLHPIPTRGSVLNPPASHPLPRSLPFLVRQAAGPLAGKAAVSVNKHTEHLAPSLAPIRRAHPSSPNTERSGPRALHAAPLPLPRSHELAWDPASRVLEAPRCPRERKPCPASRAVYYAREAASLITAADTARAGADG